MHHRYHQWTLMICLGVLLHTPAHAINAKYAQQLERSGCTQASELQGCDITKTREENAKAGFVSAAPPAHATNATNATNATKAAKAAKAANEAGKTPYAGQWRAVGPTGGTVATIRIDAKERVWVNGKKVKAMRSDGALVFRVGTITYTIQGDRHLKGEDVWGSADAGTSGPIVAE